MQRYLRLFIFACLSFAMLFRIAPAESQTDLTSIKLPPGFKISVYADAKTSNGHYLENARFMLFDADGNLYVSTGKENKVVMVTDSNKDGKADQVTLVADHLNAPQGLAFVGDSLLIANQDGVVKLDKAKSNKQDGQWSKPTPFISDLAMGWHTLKTIKQSPDGYLFVNVGSSCNVCVESEPTRATILRYTAEGKPAGALTTLGRHQQTAIWARGLRNSQGFAWHPITGAMYATNDGSDMRSGAKGGAVNDELPPEHLNKIEAGKHYGWPYCWGDAQTKKMIQDPNFVGELGFCQTTQAPEVTFTAHTTPLGITFLNKADFPADYQDDAIVALHGSWNRKQAAGYKLVRVKFDANHQASSVEDFANGWLQGNEAWGRPVDVAVGTDKALYVSDDRMGAIYRITYQPNK